MKCLLIENNSIFLEYPYLDYIAGINTVGGGNLRIDTGDEIKSIKDYEYLIVPCGVADIFLDIRSLGEVNIGKDISQSTPFIENLIFPIPF